MDGLVQWKGCSRQWWGLARLMLPVGGRSNRWTHLPWQHRRSLQAPML